MSRVKQSCAVGAVGHAQGRAVGLHLAARSRHDDQVEFERPPLPVADPLCERAKCVAVLRDHPLGCVAADEEVHVGAGRADHREPRAVDLQQRAVARQDLHALRRRLDEGAQVLLALAGVQRRLRPNELGRVLEAMDDPQQLAGVREHGRVERGPVALLDASTLALGAADLVLLDIHRIGALSGDDLLQGRSQGDRADRIVAEHVEDRSADDRLAPGLHRVEIRVTRVDDREVWIRPQHQEQRRGAVEDPLVVGRGRRPGAVFAGPIVPRPVMANVRLPVLHRVFVPAQRAQRSDVWRDMKERQAHSATKRDLDRVRPVLDRA